MIFAPRLASSLLAFLIASVPLLVATPAGAQAYPAAPTPAPSAALGQPPAVAPPLVLDPTGAARSPEPTGLTPSLDPVGNEGAPKLSRGTGADNQRGSGTFYSAESEETGDSGLYGGEGDLLGAPDDPEIAESLPEMHVVTQGDTLWRISEHYLASAWEWPRLWAQNPTITNPHWIYPGDLVRLRAATLGAAEETEIIVLPDGRRVAVPRDSRPPRDTVSLRQLAFLGADDLAGAATIVGSTEEKQLLSVRDDVYLDYPAGKPPQVGKRYAIYGETRRLRHPVTRKLAGVYVSLLGELEVLDVKKDRRARGRILYATDVIERGARVGPVKTQFKVVSPRRPDVDLEGVVVALLQSDTLIGERQVVFLDRGARDGVRLGHTLRLVRRGDAWRSELGFGTNVGQDDRQFPDDPFGEVVVVDVSERSAVAVVRSGRHEAEIGDHVVMRKERR